MLGSGALDLLETDLEVLPWDQEQSKQRECVKGEVGQVIALSQQSDCTYARAVTIGWGHREGHRAVKGPGVWTTYE